MTHERSSKIARYIVQSADKYYTYLSENDKGNEKVRAIAKRIDEYIFELHFERKILDMEFVAHILFDGKEVAIGNFKIISASHYHAELAVRESQISLFALSKEIALVVDFKRFVWNIRQAFSQEPALFLPNETAEISFDEKLFSNIGFSKPQKDAIHNIFSTPLSYIWGGAGSGKTRYVLTYSVLAYLIKNKPVMVTAPTNIALENAMSAIIPIAEKYGIDKAKIYRAGIPSPEFAKAFPQCCRNTTLENELKEQSKKLNKLKEFIVKYKNLELMEEIKSFIDIKESAEKKKAESLIELEKETLRKNLCETRLAEDARTIKSINTMIEVYEIKKRSFFYKLKKAMSAGDEIELALSKHRNTLKEMGESVEVLQQEARIHEQKIVELEELVDACSTDIKYSKISIEKILGMISNKTFEKIDYNRLKIQIKEYAEKCEYFFAGIGEQYPELELEDIEKIKDEAQRIEIKINDMLTKQQEKKKKVLLYGATLDSLSTKPDYEFVHIFLDEACYSCMAKTALLFRHKCPITFLGDHMQLPPVAEFNDEELRDAEMSPMFLWAQNGIYTCELFERNFDTLCSNYLNNDLQVPETLSTSNLLQTHRFGKNLSATIDKYVYKSGFESALDSVTEIYIIDAPKVTPVAERRGNYDEAVAIKKYLSENDVDDYAVLSPYTAQVNMLKKELKGIARDNVLTIHKSQGQEWDTVIISVSDTDNKFFTNVHNKISKGKQLLNTAISRAKKELVIVCDAAYWGSLNNQLITELIEIGTKKY